MLRDAKGTPIAVLCLNLNISIFERAKQAPKRIVYADGETSTVFSPDDPSGVNAPSGATADVSEDDVTTVYPTGYVHLPKIDAEFIQHETDAGIDMGAGWPAEFVILTIETEHRLDERWIGFEIAPYRLCSFEYLLELFASRGLFSEFHAPQGLSYLWICFLFNAGNNPTSKRLSHYADNIWLR